MTLPRLILILLIFMSDISDKPVPIEPKKKFFRSRNRKHIHRVKQEESETGIKPPNFGILTTVARDANLYSASG